MLALTAHEVLAADGSATGSVLVAILFVAAWWAVWAWACYAILRNKGYARVGSIWGGIGLGLFWIFGLIVALLIPKQAGKQAEEMAATLARLRAAERGYGQQQQQQPPVQPSPPSVTTPPATTPPATTPPATTAGPPATGVTTPATGAAVASGGAPLAPPVPAANQVPKMFCPNCGARHRAEARFCESCGRALTTAGAGRPAGRTEAA